MAKIKYAILTFLGLLIVFVVVLFWSASFLDYNSPVKTDNLVLEGWLQACELEQIGERCRNINELIVVGNEFSEGSDGRDKLLSFFQKHSKKDKSDKKGRWLFANSALLFNPVLFEFASRQDSVMITVKAKGTEANGRFAHFNLIVNGKYAGGSFTMKDIKDYSFGLSPENGRINSVAIRFDNDCILENNDRNLFIYSVTISGRQIIANRNTSLISGYEKVFTTGFGSKGEATLNYLEAVGVKSKQYRVVPFKFAKENQTLAAAYYFRDWISSTDIRAFNIVSAGFHSRRSLITYKKVLGDEYNIGVISLKSTRYNKNNWWKSPGGWFALIDEGLSYFINLLS